MAQSDKILLVDDNPVNIELLEMLLGDDYVLATATTPNAAMRFSPSSGSMSSVVAETSGWMK
jgi:CheY-like chemotaxis protein